MQGKRRLSKLAILDIQVKVTKEGIPPELVAHFYGVHPRTIYAYTEEIRRELSQRKDRKDKGILRPERTNDKKELEQVSLDYIKGIEPESKVEKKDKESFIRFFERPFERTIIYIQSLISKKVSKTFNVMNALEDMTSRGKKYTFNYNKDIVVDKAVVGYIRNIMFDRHIVDRDFIVQLTKSEFVGYGK